MRHDLRTPLNGIVGFSELLIEETAERGQKDLAGELDVLRAGGRDLLAHVDRLLSETRLQALPDVEPRDVGLELRRAAAGPLGRVLSVAERLLREAVAPPAPASVAEDLGNVRECARQFDALVAGLEGFRAGDVPADRPGGATS